jgi:hypothetical protein
MALKKKFDTGDSIDDRKTPSPAKSVTKLGVYAISENE